MRIHDYRRGANDQHYTNAEFAESEYIVATAFDLVISG